MSTPLDPKKPLYPPKSFGYVFMRLGFIIGPGLLLVTLFYVFLAWEAPEDFIMEIYLLAAIWAVGPPIWFWYEYFFVYRNHGEPDTFELFKHGQQVSLAIWAGVALALAAFASSDHFQEQEPQDCGEVTANSTITAGLTSKWPDVAAAGDHPLEPWKAVAR